MTPLTRARGQRGSAVVETVIVTPLIVSLMLFTVVGGRLALARSDVHAAASDAARAASMRARPSQAAADARTVARAALARRGVTCRSLAVRSDTRNLRPGGRVSVEVACRVDLRDGATLGVPLARTVRARATEVVDVHRGT